MSGAKRYYPPRKTQVDFPRFREFIESRGGFKTVGRAIGYGSNTLSAYGRDSCVSNKCLLELYRHYGIPMHLFYPKTPKRLFIAWMKAHPAPTPLANRPLCDARCRTCQYGSGDMLGPTATACLYILRTGKQRPCAAGAECTEYLKGDRRIYVSTRIL